MKLSWLRNYGKTPLNPSSEALSRFSLMTHRREIRARILLSQHVFQFPVDRLYIPIANPKGTAINHSSYQWCPGFCPPGVQRRGSQCDDLNMLLRAIRFIKQLYALKIGWISLTGICFNLFLNEILQAVISFTKFLLIFNSRTVAELETKYLINAFDNYGFTL